MIRANVLAIGNWEWKSVAINIHAKVIRRLPRGPNNVAFTRNDQLRRVLGCLRLECCLSPTKIVTWTMNARNCLTNYRHWNILFWVISIQTSLFISWSNKLLLFNSMGIYIVFTKIIHTTRLVKNNGPSLKRGRCRYKQMHSTIFVCINYHS